MISYVFFSMDKRLPWQANSALSHKIPSLGRGCEMAVMVKVRKIPHMGAPGQRSIITSLDDIRFKIVNVNTYNCNL